MIFVNIKTIVFPAEIEVEKWTPIEEADRISGAVKEKVHKEQKGGYNFIHVDAHRIL
jgi:divalent metal cation (Fe/Co/Zn/Cd) transporter